MSAPVTDAAVGSAVAAQAETASAATKTSVANTERREGRRPPRRRRRAGGAGPGRGDGLGCDRITENKKGGEGREQDGAAGKDDAHREERAQGLSGLEGRFPADEVEDDIRQKNGTGEREFQGPTEDGVEQALAAGAAFGRIEVADIGRHRRHQDHDGDETGAHQGGRQ